MTVIEYVPVVKVPAAEVQYALDWALWLNGDSIASSQWIVPDELTKTAESINGSQAIVKLRGGVVGKTYTVLNRIVTTVSAESNERVFKIVVVSYQAES